MAGIIIGQNYSRADKARDHKQFWVEMYPHVTRAVENSFMTEDGKVAHMTRAEVKHRVNLLMDEVNMLRKELKWNKVRIRDMLGHILNAKLAGITLAYDDIGKRASW